MNAQAKHPNGDGPIDLGREPAFALGGARIHPSTSEVEVEGSREVIQPRAMQVLVALARAKGAVVSRDQLVQLCWEGRAIGEDAINRAVAKVRAAAELSNPPAFEVETIPRIGFRLKVPAGIAQPNPALAAAAECETTSGLRRRWSVWTAALVVLALIVLAVAAYGLLLSRRRVVDNGSASRPAEASVAVLPFLNMSGDPAKEYFSDGFSEELLNDLANTPQLRVAARTSSFAFKGKRADVREIANKLHVRAVLEGSVREAGDRVRITAQLIDGASGYHLWSQTYDRQLTDILKVQDDISRDIASALTNKLLSGRPSSNAVDPDAYRKYLLAKSLFDHHTDADNEHAIALFKEVTTLQPDFSDGFAMLGYAYLGRVVETDQPDREMAARVTRAALDRALALDHRNLTALIAEMDLALFYSQDWNAAGEFVRRMRQINPNNALVARAAGLYYQFLGFPEQSRNAFKLAAKLDPLSAVTWGSLAVVEAIANHNDEAIAAGNTAVALGGPNANFLGWVCIAYAAKGDFQQARKLAAELAHLSGGKRRGGCAMEIARRTQDRVTARRIIEERVKNKEGDPAYLGQNYLLVGEYQKALPFLQQAYDVGDTSLYTLPADPVTPRDFLKSEAWKRLKQLPRFRAWQAAHDAVAASLRAPH